MTPQERIDFYTNKTDGCWIWQGNLSARGYGRITIDGRTWMAHKLSYQLAVGDVGNETVLHHICANKACVRPSHLEPVTQSEKVGEMLARRVFEQTIRRQAKRIAELESELAALKRENVHMATDTEAS